MYIGLQIVFSPDHRKYSHAEVKKEQRQVNEKFLELKEGHIGIVEKAKETSSDSGMHNRAITVLHEQWMCPGMQRHTHITLCSMVTI